MQLSKIVMASLLGLALGSPIDKRTPAEVEADIATVSSDLTSFNTAINAFTGSLIQALSLLISYNNLASAITTATSQVTSTGALSSADSATIYADVDSLTAQITDTLSDATAKVRATGFYRGANTVPITDYASSLQVSVVASSGYTSTVCSALSTLSVSSRPLWTLCVPPDIVAWKILMWPSLTRVRFLPPSKAPVSHVPAI